MKTTLGDLSPLRTRHCRCRLGIMSSFCAMLLAQGARAELTVSSSTASASAASAFGAALAAPLPELPLPVLSKPPPRVAQAPQPAELEAIDRLLSALMAAEKNERASARVQLSALDESLVPAIAERLRREAESADKLAMKELLHKLRLTAREEVRAELRAASVSSKVVTPDYLDVLLEHPLIGDRAWKSLTRVTALSRMLSAIGTLEATRELINVYVRFGEFLRIDTQRALEKLGDKSVPALIEATTHQAPKIAAWASRQLELRDRDKPGAVVQTQDRALLADILRAYGTTRDPDVSRLVISFANSEHAEVRRAAREAMALFGDVANWPIRDTYEQVTGKRPSREWSWERTARELFREFDRTRLADTREAYASAVAAHNAGDLEKMREALDLVLTRDPDFDGSEAVAALYLEYANERVKSSAEDAALALERALRIAKDPTLTRKAQSLLFTLDAERLKRDGIWDQILLRRAKELDPDNERASRALAEMEAVTGAAPSPWVRFSAAFAIALLTLGAIVLLLRRGKPKAPAPMSASIAEP